MADLETLEPYDVKTGHLKEQWLKHTHCCERLDGLAEKEFKEGESFKIFVEFSSESSTPDPLRAPDEKVAR